MKKDDTQIGFVGVGRMGANMARHLNDNNYHLTAVYDIDTPTAQALASELACAVADSPSQVAEKSNIVMTVVTDDAAMNGIYAEGRDDSLLSNANGCMFINCATISPQVHMDIETRIEKHGGRSLEACMASSIPQARNGTLYLMCGGKRDVFDQATPLLETLSSTLRYVGHAGTAAQVKALVNMVMNANTAALAEGLGLGEAMGLDLTMLREIFAQTGAASRVLETDGEDMQHREHECYFSSTHARKDCGIALNLASSLKRSLPIAETTYRQYDRLVQAGKGELDKSAVAELTFRGRDT